MTLAWAALTLLHAGALHSPAAPLRRAALSIVRPNVVTPIFTEVAKLGGLADALGDEGDQFGSAVAMDGDTVAVGAPFKDSTGSDAGAAYVFFRAANAWTLQATLLPPALGDDQAFGVSVAISNDTLVIGATGSVSSPGGAYVYVRSGQTWSLQAPLIGLDTGPGDRFGERVAVSGHTVVVSAPRATTGFGSLSGAAYVFLRIGSSWSQQQKVLATDIAANDRFGAAVALDGDSMVVGASDDDTASGENAGSAYVFTRTGGVWTQQQKILPSVGSAYDSFGGAVSLSADVAVVGASGADTGLVLDSGRGFVFERQGGVWTETATLGPPTPSVAARFGADVAVSGDLAVLGSSGTYASVMMPVHLFRASGGTWGLEASLPTGGAPPASFGTAVAASGGSVLVGASGGLGASGLEATGAAYAFTMVSGAWAEQARLDNTGTTAGDAFGSTVVVDGATMAVGSPSDDTLSGSGSGSVTVFERTAGVWTALQKLVPEVGNVQGFGRSVALEGNLLIVGARVLSSVNGAAYVFRRGATWGLEQKLETAVMHSDFGAKVATSGGIVLVGAPDEGLPGVVRAGVAHVFSRPAGVWVAQERLLSPAPTEFGRFGAGLGLDGDVAVIGAPGSTPKAHVFRRGSGTWTLSQELTGTQSGEVFGTAVAVSGTDLAIGSPGSDSPMATAGSVYVFQYTGGSFSLVDRLPCPTTTLSARCGTAVALTGDTLVAGAPFDMYAFTGAGSAALFSRNGGRWALGQQLVPSDSVSSPSFGSAVALAGNQVILGAPFGRAEAHESGAVYVFEPAATDLTLSMTASPIQVSQGDLVTMGLTLTNAGPAAVAGAAAGVTLQPGLVFGSPVNGSCVAAQGGATCAFPRIASGASAAVEFKAVAAGVGVFNSTATVPAGGPSAQATTTILAAGSDLSVTIGAPATATRSGTLDYWLEVRNNGPAPAAAILLTHPTPVGLVLESVSGPSCASLPCTIPWIPVAGTGAVRAVYRVPGNYSGPDPITSTATVTAANADPVPGNNTATGTTPLLVENTDLLLHTVSPCRLVDTREAGLGGPLPLPPGPAFYTAGAGTCGIPYSARALAVNVAVTQPTADGYLKLYPSNAAAPLASFVNYAAGQTRSNNGIIGLDASSRFVVEVGQASGTAHVIVDVVGYFQ